ncbi:MAG TPA: hypothetical protein VFD70_00190 [Anaerolineae bacterium]|nr:hypothetical protein [Anaerolineae bacterium]
MKAVRRVLIALTALAIVVGFGAGTALAAGKDPASATYVDNQTHSIAGSPTEYYRFEYNGNNSLITIRLLNGANGSVAFNVYTPEQINETTWWILPPIGRGTKFGNDLQWAGRFYAPGTYIIEVQNFSPQSQSYTLAIEGADVRLCPAGTTPCPVAPPPQVLAQMTTQ